MDLFSQGGQQQQQPDIPLPRQPVLSPPACFAGHGNNFEFSSRVKTLPSSRRFFKNGVGLPNLRRPSTHACVDGSGPRMTALSVQRRATRKHRIAAQGACPVAYHHSWSRRGSMILLRRSFGATVCLGRTGQENIGDGVCERLDVDRPAFLWHAHALPARAIRGRQRGDMDARFPLTGQGHGIRAFSTEYSYPTRNNGAVERVT